MMIIMQRYITPFSAKARALQTYQDGTHSHNATFHINDYSTSYSENMPSYLKNMHELMDIALAYKAEIEGRSHLIATNLACIEIMKESDHIEVMVFLTDVGQEALLALQHGYVWDTHEDQISIEQTKSFYADCIKHKDKRVLT